MLRSMLFAAALLTPATTISAAELLYIAPESLTVPPGGTFTVQTRLFTPVYRCP